MKAILIKNGTAYECSPKTAMNHNGFCEISVFITGKSKSVLYSTGTLHWVLPSDLHEPGTVKKTKNGCQTKTSATARAAFLDSLPKCKAIDV